ncbi:MAG: hypothetical protein F4Y08_05035 [Caldilineaceae bacterium SB0662_bin_9]|uniref:Uncharacterized protein n=1 Tax=Caldilineaceae bacterium SB0662_bin_9 TaxID=2605258 RepID=A0A6B1DQ34_9CHLR|nr:hypothetical protein [Rhodospirillales bacterium]MYD89690.1 hypothetical protein [Caldilineaceae bacterium SB0662_bin_9]
MDAFDDLHERFDRLEAAIDRGLNQQRNLLIGSAVLILAVVAAVWAPVLILVARAGGAGG